MSTSKDYVRLASAPAPRPPLRLTTAGVFWLGYIAFVAAVVAALYFGGVVLAAAQQVGAIIDMRQLVTTCALIGVIAAIAALYWTATGGESRD